MRWTKMAGPLLVALALVVVACDGGRQRRDESEGLIGRPPPDDPFLVGELPAEAVPASPRGAIGDAEEEEMAEAEAEAPAAAASPGVPEDPEDPRLQCFSCVQLCPIDEEGRSQCERGKKDVICGWGVDAEPDRAEALARAECDAALDMAREMPRWSRIEGRCPQATCRNGSGGGEGAGGR